MSFRKPGLAGLVVTACLTTIVVPSAVHAQEPVAIEQGTPWIHPHSGIAMPAAISGLDQRRAAAFADDLLDVAVEYSTLDKSEVLTIYVFRKTNADVSVWFEQARFSVEGRASYNAPRLVEGPVSFVPAGQPNASGLRAIYAPGSGSAYRSTGLALFEVNGWYVKIRASSVSRQPDMLAAYMDEIIGQLTLPVSNAAAIASVLPCERPLVFGKKSRDLKQDGAAVLMQSLLGTLPAELENENGTTQPQPVWCRDATIAPGQITYRANESDDSYLLAIGDNGNAIIVAPDQSAQLLGTGNRKPKAGHAVTLKQAGLNTYYMTQDRIPSPQRALELVNKNRVTSSYKSWGDEKNLSINVDTLE